MCRFELQTEPKQPAANHCFAVHFAGVVVPPSVTSFQSSQVVVAAAGAVVVDGVVDLVAGVAAAAVEDPEAAAEAVLTLLALGVRAYSTQKITGPLSLVEPRPLRKLGSIGEDSKDQAKLEIGSTSLVPRCL